MTTTTKVCLAALLGSLLGQVLLGLGMPITLALMGRGIGHRNRIAETKIRAIELRRAIDEYGISNSTFSLRDALQSRKFLTALGSLSEYSNPVIFVSQGPIDLQKPFRVETFYRLRDLKSGYMNISSPESTNTPEPELIEAQ